MKRKSSYEGLQENIRKLKTPKIEVWRNQYPDKEYMVSMEALEFTCICPKTGLPDFAKFTIQYIPDKFCVELKSFKLYLNSYRNIGVFHEHVTNRILDDFVKASKPRFVRIEGGFNIRGGIKTTVSAEYRE
ncbi:MAG: NADPH-dependent 7-cyano-7-deazaguanine reductase QueF [Candidatus Omnitrophica bacterium]|nr:NADPH-dependent 7-cyano-7-deazaguanine reductase QueF [Candidatus Omnitrophota bacterium]